MHWIQLAQKDLLASFCEHGTERLHSIKAEVSWSAELSPTFHERRAWRDVPFTRSVIVNIARNFANYLSAPPPPPIALLPPRDEVHTVSRFIYLHFHLAKWFEVHPSGLWHSKQWVTTSLRDSRAVCELLRSMRIPFAGSKFHAPNIRHNFASTRSKIIEILNVRYGIGLLHLFPKGDGKYYITSQRASPFPLVPARGTASKISRDWLPRLASPEIKTELSRNAPACRMRLSTSSPGRRSSNKTPICIFISGFFNSAFNSSVYIVG